jgi:chromosomal replication initiation ATPase DnaA
MNDNELNEIGKWLNTKGFDLNLKDCFWMEDYIANETTFRELASLLKDYINKEKINYVTTIDKFCDFINIPFETLKIKTRKRKICEPRQVLMYLLKLDGFKKKEIALIFKKDRTTVYHAFKTVKNLIIVDEKFRNKYNL